MNSEYQATQINLLLNELSTLYTDLQYEEQYATEEDQYTYESIQRMRNNIKDLAKRLYNTCLIFLEINNLKSIILLFQKEIYPQLNSETLFAYSYHEESGDYYSSFMSEIWSYLLSFEEFGASSTELLAKRAGIVYVEHILESTAVIIKDLNIVPTSEKQVYDAVKLISKAVFPTASFPTESFQKMAKCYIPDILIASLNCAIEYKFAKTEQKLIDTIDQILIDVQGYRGNETFKLFYAVFYSKPGILTRTRFTEVWHEKHFPDNWKGILVEGPTD